MALGRKTGGRKKSTFNTSTAAIMALAQVHTADAIAELARLATHAESEVSRRVSGARARLSVKLLADIPIRAADELHLGDIELDRMEGAGDRQGGSSPSISGMEIPARSPVASSISSLAPFRSTTG